MKLALAAGTALAALAACTGESGTGVDGCTGNSCNHGTTGRSQDSAGGSSSGSGSGNGSSSGGSSGAASTSGSSSGSVSGTSSSPSSGGSSGGNSITCSNITAFVWDGGSCPTSWYGTRFADLGTCAPIAGATVEALGVNGAPISGASATTDGTGDFAFCLPAGSIYTPYLQAANYPPSYLAQQNGPPPQEWIGLVSTDTLGAVSGFLAGNFDASKGVLAVFFSTYTHPTCNDQSGWSVTLSLPDGGAFPDGGYLISYLGNSGLPDSSLTATTTSGSAIAYDIDTSISNYVAVSVSNPDAGVCEVQIAQFGETGLVYVAGNALSYFAPHLVEQ
jgi:hypothetical protein